MSKNPLNNQLKQNKDSQTAGFSAGVSLDVNGSKTNTNSNSTTSNASVLQANNIFLQTNKDLPNTSINITGSNVIANENLNVIASQDSSNQTQNSKSVNGSIAYTMYGGGGGTANLGYGTNNSNSNSVVNHNSNLQANNMNINVSNDANFVGATVRANDTLNLKVGNNLNVESLRDEYSSSNKGFNVNAGVGFGSAGAQQNRTPSLDVGRQSSINAGFSVNNGISLDKQTVLSSITGNKVNVDVKGNTDIKGSLIASGNFDKNNNFIDNKNLNLTTNTLTYENMSNTNYSSNQSLGAKVNYNLESTKVVDNKSVHQEAGISSASYNASNSLDVNASKTLATLGQGNINIKDTANSDDLSRLNTDTTKINKDLYSASTGTKVDATLDTRLLTEDGRKQIVNEAKTASTILTSINQILSTDRATGIDFFKETEKNVKVLDGIRSTISSNPELAKQLSDPNVTPEQKQSMINNVATTVAISLGYIAPNTKLVYTDETGASNEQIKGHYSTQTNTSYVNDKNNDSTVELVNTTAHETQHYMDAKNNLNVTDKADNEKYVNNFASTVTDYVDYALSYTGNQGMATTNDYNQSSSSSVLIANNKEFSGVDKSLGEDSISKIVINMNEYKNKTNYGTALVYVDGESNPREIKITSGNNTPDYTKSNAGPTPPGAYLIDPSKSQNMSISDRIDDINQSNNELSTFNLIRKYPGDWGSFRVPLEPANSTNTYNRTGMYIHGGKTDGSSGCIDCGNNDNWLFGEVRDTKKFIPVEIKYDENYKK